MAGMYKAGRVSQTTPSSMQMTPLMWWTPMRRQAKNLQAMLEQVLSFTIMLSSTSCRPARLYSDQSDESCSKVSTVRA